MAGRTDSMKLLIKFGFVSKEGAQKFPELKGKRLDAIEDKARRKEIEKQLEDMSEVDLEKYADEHEIEMAAWQMHKTPYPTPNVTQGDHFPDPMYYRLIWETFQRPIESFYFFIVEQFRDLGFGKIDKVQDIFAASEQSSFYGVQQQRIGLHQDKVAQFLKGISELVRQLFQITREIRIIKERLHYYKDSKKSDKRIYEAAEIALKGMYVDLVEGGAKNASSVFGMAQQLQFTTLPDLFFATHPRNRQDVGKIVDERRKDFNPKVREVLKRKLYSYMTWKEETEKELEMRERHTLKYLRQHYDVIQLYITWIKPYLKQTARLTQDTRKIESPDLIAAFEGSMVEIELIGRFLPRGNKKYYATVLINILYRTSPTMPFSQDYQRGPLHQGKVDMVWRYYTWSDEDVKRYMDMRKKESFNLLSNIDENIKASLEALGDELNEYLIEAGKEMEPKVDEVAKKQEGFGDIMMAPFKGFGDSFGALFPKGSFKLFDSESKKRKTQIEADIKEIKLAHEVAAGLGWLHYRNFKKGHGLVTW